MPVPILKRRETSPAMRVVARFTARWPTGRVARLSWSAPKTTAAGAGSGRSNGQPPAVRGGAALFGVMDGPAIRRARTERVEALVRLCRTGVAKHILSEHAKDTDDAMMLTARHRGSAR
jgi:hypothetical protein